MKKLLTFAFVLFMGVVSVSAQTDESDDTFKFVDKDGNEVPDGSELTITETEDDGWGGIMMKTGLYVKSTKSGKVYGSMAYNIIEISNGAFQVCFPQNCTVQEAVGEYETPYGEVKTEDIMAEWMPVDYGTAKVSLQPKTYSYNDVTDKYTFKGNGPKVTLNFVYADPAGITDLEVNNKTEVGRYALDGRKLDKPEHGINIVKTKSGKTYKELIK